MFGESKEYRQEKFCLDLMLTVNPVGINSSHEMSKLETLFYEDVNNFKLKYNFVREMLIKAPFKLQYNLRKLKSRRVFQESETEF